MSGKPGGRKSTPIQKEQPSEPPQEPEAPSEPPTINADSLEKVTEMTPKNLEMLAMEQKAMDLRMAGLTYQAMSEQLGLSKTSCFNYVHRVLDRSIKESTGKADQLRQLQTQRIERLILAIWSRALGRPARREGSQVMPAEPPDLEAGKTIVGTYIPQLAKLHGLYKAEELIISGGEDPVKMNLEDASDEQLQQISTVFHDLIGVKEKQDGDGPARIPPGRFTKPDHRDN